MFAALAKYLLCFDSLYTKEYTPIAICGALRKKGNSDAAVEKLAQEAGLL